jgi:hypothetical protein
VLSLKISVRSPIQIRCDAHTFQAKPMTESGSAGMKWILVGLVMLVIIVLLAK